MQKFSAQIYKVGINPCVDIPAEISCHFAQRGYVSVRGTLNDFPVRATLVPMREGRHRLFINGEMRQGAGVKTGEVVQFALEFDPEPRALPVPDELARAFRQVRGTKAAFEKLTEARRREIIRWFLAAQKPETKARRIEHLLIHLTK